MLRRRLLSAVAILALSACTRHVDDLSFVSIEAWRGSDTPDNLQLHFRSGVNLRKLAESAETDGAWARISLCPYHDTPWIGLGRVLHNGIDLETRPFKSCVWKSGVLDGCGMANDTPEVRAEIANSDQSGPYVYDVRFIYKGWQEEATPEGSSTQRVAMPAGPHDLCVKVQGWTMLGGGIDSNEIRIPADALAKALATTTPPRTHN